MEEAEKAIYQALRDDSEATNGLRALLGNTTTSPYNVYYAFLPENVDFSAAGGSKAFVTVLLASSVADLESRSPAARLMQDVYQITAYARELSKVRSIQRRIRWRLDNLRGITLPTTIDQFHNVALETYSADRYDDKFDCRWQMAEYRVWRRDDDLR